MKKSIATILAIAMLCIPIAAYSGEGCGAVLAQGYKNISHEVYRHEAYVSAFRTFCSESYDSANSSTKASLDVAYRFLQVGLGLEENDVQQAWHRYCELQEDIGISSTFRELYSETIHEGIIDAWLQCRELDSRGLRTKTNTTHDETAVTVQVSWQGSRSSQFLGIDQPDSGKALCVANGRQKPIESNTKFSLTTKIVTINCSRIFDTTADGTEYSKWTRLVFKTIEGSFIVDLAPIELGSYRTAYISGLNEEIASLEAENAELRAKLDEPVFDWIGSDGDSCESVCAARSMTAVSSGARTGGVHAYGQPYYVCAANAHYEGYRPGWNVQPSWAHQCGVSWGPAAESYSSYYCLCER